MARRSSKAETTLIVLAIVVGVPLYLFSKLVESVGWIPRTETDTV